MENVVSVEEKQKRHCCSSNEKHRKCEEMWAKEKKVENQ